MGPIYHESVITFYQIQAWTSQVSVIMLKKYDFNSRLGINTAQECKDFESLFKNPAYRRHQISQPMRIVGRIQI